LHNLQLSPISSANAEKSTGCLRSTRRYSLM